MTADDERASSPERDAADTQPPQPPPVHEAAARPPRPRRRRTAQRLANAAAVGETAAHHSPGPDNADATPAGDQSAPAAVPSATNDSDSGRPLTASTLGELAISVLRREYASIREHEGGMLRGDDPEAVHEMRVALRRLRAALSLFRAALPDDFQPFRSEFAWVAALLGAVRDLDVLIGRVAAVSSELSPEASPGLGAVTGWLEGERTAARQQLLAALDAPRYQDIITGFAAALERGDSSGGRLAAEPVLLVAPALVERQYRRLREAGDGLTPKSSASAYHRLRLRAKRFRYALDFFGEVYGPAVRPLRRRLADLQSVLGDQQDVETAQLRLRKLQRSHTGELAERDKAALDELVQRFKEQGAALRRDVPKTYGSIIGKRWQRLRVILEVRRVRAVRASGVSPEPPPASQHFSTRRSAADKVRY